jgi:hypothetical protein
MKQRDAGSVHCLGSQSSTCPVLFCFICLGLYIPFGVIFFDDEFPPNADAEEVAASLSQAGLVF